MKKLFGLILLLALFQIAAAQQPWYRCTFNDYYGSNLDIRCKIKEIRQNGFDLSYEVLAEGPKLLRLIHLDEYGNQMWFDTIVSYSSIQDDSHGDVVHEQVPFNVIVFGNQALVSGGNRSVIKMFESSIGTLQWQFEKVFSSSANQINSICQNSFWTGDTLYAFQNDSILFIDPFNNGVLLGGAPFGQIGYDVAQLPNGDFLMKTDSTLKRVSFTGSLIWSIPNVVSSDLNDFFPHTACTADAAGNVSRIDLATGNTLWTAATGLQHISCLENANDFGVIGVTDNNNYLQQHSMFRIDSVGNILWTKNYDAALYGFDAVKNANNDGIVVGGTYFTSKAFFYQPTVEDVNNTYGAFIVQADSLGNGPEKIGNIWTGDINADSIFDATDGLFLGIAMGSSGEDRVSKGIPQVSNPFGDMVPSVDWGQAFAGGVDFKHADGNGDGVVTTADATYISSMGSSHPNWRGPSSQISSGGFCLDYAVSNDTVAPGQTFAVYVIAGIPIVPVDSAYAFYIEPDIPNISLINVSQSSFVALASDFGTPNSTCFSYKGGSPVIGVGNNYYVTRTNQQNALQLNDTIAAFYLTASASVTVPTVFNIGFMNGMKINLSGAIETLTPCTPTLSVVIDPTFTGLPESVAEQFALYPNPSGGQFQITPSLTERVMKIYDTAGRLVKSERIPAGKGNMDLSFLENGTYMLFDDKGKVVRAVICR